MPVLRSPVKVSDGVEADARGTTNAPVMVSPAFSTLLDAAPVNAAVIVPAVKLPLASRATIADAVLALVAVVALLLTLPAVEMVLSLASAMAAEALISSLTITPAAMEVALPTEVTSPVRFALVVTVEALPVNAPAKVVAVTVPTTCSAVVGELVPMPTSPVDVMRRRSEPFVCAIKALGAPRFMEALNPVEVLLVVGVSL